MAIHIAHADDGLAETHEINVTPFIDVMLVLLVIFMVTVPLSTVDVPVNLPVSNAQQKQPESKPVYVTLQSDFAVSIGDRKVDRQKIGDALLAETKGNRETQIFLRADKAVDYEHLMGLLNALRDPGYYKVSLVAVSSGAD